MEHRMTLRTSRILHTGDGRVWGCILLIKEGPVVTS